MLIIGARTKWPEVEIMKSTTASATISVFQKIFSRFGLPHHVVSDNGTQYASAEFAGFLRSLGVKHSFAPVKHPATNGAAENFVKVFKKKVKAMLKDGKKIQQAIGLFLFDYRTTKHSTTGESPAKLIFNRELRTRFSLLQPNITRTVLRKQAQQIESKGGRRHTKFAEEKVVWARDFRKDAGNWNKAKITEQLGPVTYKVRFDDNGETKRHANQLAGRPETTMERKVRASNHEEPQL